MSLEYQLRFYQTDLEDKIVDFLRRNKPEIPLEEAYRLAHAEVEEMKKQGNYAPFLGMAMFCASGILRKVRFQYKDHANTISISSVLS